MELMEELQTWLEEVEQKIQTYKPRQKTLDAIQTNPVWELEFLIYENYQKYNQYKKGAYINKRFKEMTQFTLDKVAEMSEEVRIDVRNRILQRLQSLPMDEFEIVRCYDYFAKPIKERLHFITKGHNAEECNWLTGEQMFDIQQKLIELVMMEFDEILELKTEYRLEKAKLALELALLEKKTRHTERYIMNSEIKRMVDTESECEVLKGMIKMWYKKTNQTFMEDLIEGRKDNPTVEDFREWMYLMTPEKQQQVRELCQMKIKREFEAYREKTEAEITSGSKKQAAGIINNVKMLKRELKQVLEL